LISSWHWDSGYGQQRILADSSHHTLYVYCVMGRHIKCKNGHTSANRPPLIAHGRLKAGAGVDQSKLRTRRLSDGERQVTYYGQPLYLYTRDGQPYKVHGETWAARCGTRQWNVIRTNGQPVTEPLKCGTPF
jgi:predicted lipoprotein with Yx(FWY)xxD motif